MMLLFLILSPLLGPRENTEVTQRFRPLLSLGYRKDKVAILILSPFLGGPPRTHYLHSSSAVVFGP